jgi:ribosomal protein S18 acetylase RimI-like enzyme
LADPSFIRPASEDDADRLAKLAERTFRDTFAADNAPADMEAYVAESLSLDRVRAELADSKTTFLLAFIGDAGEPAGYAKLRSGTPDPSVTGDDPIELERLYVDRRMIGQRVGAALMRGCLNFAQSAGFQTIWLGVWERNTHAIAFYERWGFEAVGDHVFRLGSDNQRDLIMQRSVSASS